MHISLFDLAREQLEGQLAPINCTKSTLVHLSHTLEDVILVNRIPAMMFTGFQESSHWAKETARYREIAGIAKQVCIFAGKPLPAEQAARAIQITLDGEDPLRQEWFVLILSDSFSVLLCGKDYHTDTDIDALREFETLLSFDKKIIDSVADRLETVLTHYLPEQAEKLRQARQQFTHRSQTDFVTLIFTEMMRFENQLSTRLMEAQQAQIRINADLRAERRFNKRLIEASPAFIITLDLDLNIVMMSPSLLNTLGYQLNDVIGKDWRQLGLAPIDHAILKMEYETILRFRRPSSMELKILKRDGTSLPVEWTTNLIYNVEGQPQYYLTMGADISHRKRLEALRREEERLRMMLEQERETARVRNQFIQTVSHEFRTPLATIQSSSELMSLYFDRLTPEARARRLQTIKDQVQHLTSMVEDITILMQTDNMQLSYQPQPIDIRHVCEDIIEDLSMASMGGGRIVSNIEWDFAEVSGDPRLLKHILYNMLANALKYSSVDTPVFFALRQEASEMVFEIADQGIGIPEEDAPYIGRAFYRGNNVGNIIGSGLGLKIAIDCIQLYHGRMRHFRNERSGTTFVVRLPFE